MRNRLCKLSCGTDGTTKEEQMKKQLSPLLVLTLLSGCAAWFQTQSRSGVGKTPVALTGVSSGLDWLILASVVITAASIGLFFYLPAGHRISGAMGIGGACTLGISLLLKTTLWMIPWLAGGLVVLGLIYFFYELWYKSKHGEFDNLGDGKGNL